MQNDEYTMVFGSFSLKSKPLGSEASSPMCAIAKIENNKIKKFIYLEDTLATALTFKVGVESLFHTIIGESGFFVILIKFPYDFWKGACTRALCS